jgi:uncharacterized membrane protein YfcA
MTPDWLMALMPPELSGGVVAGLLAASFGTSFMTVAFGIGGGAVMLAILASLLPPAALIPVHGVIQIGSNVGRAAILVRHMFWPVAPAFFAGSAVGAALGGAVVMSIPPSMVQIGVGLFIIWSVTMRPPAIFRRWGALTGGISSFLTMFFGATGPFVAAFVKSHDLGRESHVATHATLMASQHVLKTLAFGILGFAFGPWVPFILAMIVFGFLGTLAGRQVLTRITDARFHKVLTVILILVSLRLIWGGVSDLFG